MTAEHQAVHDLIRAIRDIINVPRPQHAIMQRIHDWHQLCSALDVVEDTTQAIHSYAAVEYPDDTGQRYLLLYGLLQALYVHQDGIKNIAEALGMNATLPPVMQDVRRIRNDAVGHPSKRGFKEGRTTHHFIVRISPPFFHL